MLRRLLSPASHYLLLLTLLSYPLTNNAQPTDPTPPTLETTILPASTTVPVLSLQEAILLAMRMNPEVKNAKLQRVVDKFALAVARNQFLPQVKLSASALYQNNGTPDYSAFPGVSWLSPSGTKLESTLTQAINNDNNTVTNNATATITQPLLRGFGNKVTRIDLENALDAEKINQLNFKSQVIDIVIKVVNTYYDLVQAHNNLQADQLSLQDAQKTLQQTQAKIKAGKAAPADGIQQKATIATQQLNVSVDENKLAQRYQELLTVLGLDPNARIHIVETIPTVTTPLPDLNRSFATALANNLDYQKTLVAYQNAERALLKAKDARRWQLDAVAGLNQQLNNSNTESTSKSLTLNLNIPIHDIDRQKALVEANIGLDKAKTEMLLKKRQLITDVTNAYHELAFNKKQIDLYKNSIQLAQQSLNIAKIKYSYGKITPFELDTLQTALIKTQLGFIAQQVSYLKTNEDFYRLLSTTLERWNLILTY